MRSNLFGEHLETSSSEPMALQNPRMLKVRLGDGSGGPSDVLARQGAMVAYQGQVEFAYEGAGGMGKLLKKVVTGEGVPLMRCRGVGDVFLAQDANELHVLDLDGDSVTVNGSNVLAFDPTLQSAIAWSAHLQTRLVRTAGAGALVGRGSGEAFQLAFNGQGFLIVQASEGPVVPKHDHGGGGGGGLFG